MLPVSLVSPVSILQDDSLHADADPHDGAPLLRCAQRCGQVCYRRSQLSISVFISLLTEWPALHRRRSQPTPSGGATPPSLATASTWSRGSRNGALRMLPDLSLNVHVKPDDYSSVRLTKNICRYKENFQIHSSIYHQQVLLLSSQCLFHQRTLNNIPINHQ